MIKIRIEGEKVILSLAEIYEFIETTKRYERLCLAYVRAGIVSLGEATDIYKKMCEFKPLYNGEIPHLRTIISELGGLEGSLMGVPS